MKSSEVKVTQSFLTVCDPMDYTVHEILQVRILEWVAFPFSRDLPNPGIKPRSPTLQVDFLSTEPQGKPRNTGVGSLSLLQQIFLTHRSNRGLLHCRQILYQVDYYFFSSNLGHFQPLFLWICFLSLSLAYLLLVLCVYVGVLNDVPHFSEALFFFFLSMFYCLDCIITINIFTFVYSLFACLDLLWAFSSEFFISVIILYRLRMSTFKNYFDHLIDILLFSIWWITVTIPSFNYLNMVS